MDIQNLINTMSDISSRERGNYHLTFGDLIDKLKNAPEGSSLDDRVKGIGAYRGYYSDMALLTESVGTECVYGGTEYNSQYNMNDCVDEVESKELPKDAKELGNYFESLIGKYTDGYKGGEHEITRDRPLWLATDYGDCSSTAIVGISDDLKLITKEVE